MKSHDDFIIRLSKDIERRINLEKESREKLMDLESTRDKENGIRRINSASLQKSKQDELPVTPSEVLLPQSSHLSAERSTMMNSLDFTTKELQSYMKGLFANAPDVSVQKLETHRVEEAVNCAKTINELMKTKLEAIKFFKAVEK